MGFSAAYNRSATAAWHDNCDWICLMNTDVLVCDGWLDEVAKVLEHNEQLGIVGPVQWDWKSDTPSYFFRNRYPSVLKKLNHGPGHYPADWLEGSCLFIKRECWEDLKGLDCRYPFYWEDADLCRRARRQGWPVEIVTASHIRHYGGGSSETQYARTNALKQRYHFFFKLTNPNHHFCYNIFCWSRMLITICSSILSGPERLRQISLTAANLLWVLFKAQVIFCKWRQDRMVKDPSRTSE